tara:strand:- start:104 stop:400 length:297 start_codon:yes stop_codon:yes gene_type:complete
MNIEDLKKAESCIKDRYEKEMREIAIEYAKANQSFEIGQIIDNGVSRIKIERVKFSGWSFGSPPCCLYFGRQHTLKNKPYKKDFHTSIRDDERVVLVG